MTVIGDILVVQTMKETGFTIEDYSKRHHGGYLGEKSRAFMRKVNRHRGNDIRHYFP